MFSRFIVACLAPVALALAWPASTIADSTTAPAAAPPPKRGDAMAQFYPTRALMLGVEGASRVRCRILATGRLANCALVSEDPAGYGFGEASVAMAEATLHVAPLDNRGVPVRGGTITVFIAWKLPPGFAPSSQPPAPVSGNGPAARAASSH